MGFMDFLSEVADLAIDLTHEVTGVDDIASSDN